MALALFKTEQLKRYKDIVALLIKYGRSDLVKEAGLSTPAIRRESLVVLGKEPVLPTFTKEELQDPFNAKKLADAQAALEAYQSVRTNAQNLHIPILNQNRFLYLIGYYDQSRR